MTDDRGDPDVSFDAGDGISLFWWREDDILRAEYDGSTPERVAEQRDILFMKFASIGLDPYQWKKLK